MHLRLPKLRQVILNTGSMGRCSHLASEHEGLAGKDESGCFKTARGKIYPLGLNRALADAIADYVQTTFAGPSNQDLPHDFVDLLVKDFVPEEIVQPDFYS